MSSTGNNKNPVKSAFKLVQQVWGKTITVAACTPLDQPFQFRFKYLEIIGNGTFGIVCKAQDMDSGETVAIKTVLQDEGHQNRELSIIKALRHPNIVTLKGYFYTRNQANEEYLSLILEYIPQSLDRILREHDRRKEPIPIPIIQTTMFQFLKALEYLHALGICHRDIKPHNLLYDPASGVIKLCDFGCSKRLIDGEPNIQYICARYYRAPEIVFGWPHYSCAIDLWSAGCVMMELFTGKPAFAGKNSIDQLARIVKVLGAPMPTDLESMGQTDKKFLQPTMGKATVDPSSSVSALALASKKPIPWSQILPSTCPQEAQELIGRLLRYNPSERIKPSEALRHPFFQTILAVMQINSDGAKTSTASNTSTISLSLTNGLSTNNPADYNEPNTLMESYMQPS